MFFSSPKYCLMQPHSLLAHYLCTGSASGASSVETPLNSNSCSRLSPNANPNSAVKKAKLWSEAAPISLCPLRLSLPPPESVWVDWPPPGACLPYAGPAASQGSTVAAPGQSGALKPELQHCVLIPAGKTSLTLSGAFSQHGSEVTSGLWTFCTPLCSCAERTKTALFIDFQSVLLRFCLTELTFWWSRVINRIELERFSYMKCYFCLLISRCVGRFYF